MTARAAAAVGNLLIESLGVYLPPHAVSTQDVVDGCRQPLPLPLGALTGIRHRRVAEGEFSDDLATTAAQRCLAMSRHGAGELDTVIACNISRTEGPAQHRLSPSSAAVVADRIGASRARTFDIGNACAGVFTGMAVAEAMLTAGTTRRVLLVSGEHITHLAETAQREHRLGGDDQLASLTLGDAGAALLLELTPRSDIGLAHLALRTYGEHSGLCVAEAHPSGDGTAIMRTASADLSAKTAEQAVRDAAEVLDQPEVRRLLDGSQPVHLIPHQISAPSIRMGGRALNTALGRQVFRDAQVVINVAERGNTATTSHTVALWDAILSGRVNSGDVLVFSIAASGITVGTAVYTLDDLPERLAAHQFVDDPPRPRDVIAPAGALA
jgi:3-oxoacyl-[acyl-carrier-protein] synthase III